MAGALQTSDDRVLITIRHRQWQHLVGVLSGRLGDAAFPVERIEVIAFGAQCNSRQLAGGAALGPKAAAEKFSARKDRGPPQKPGFAPRFLRPPAAPARPNVPNTPWEDSGTASAWGIATCAVAAVWREGEPCRAVTRVLYDMCGHR